MDFALESMIQQQLLSRGIVDQNVIRSFRKVSRKTFVPDYLMHQAYADEVLPIGLGQTLSAPYTVARMMQELQIDTSARVLEVGTGSGFQTALLSAVAKTVYSVEVLPELSARARKVLVDDLGIDNVQFRVADGYHGWSDEAPFDGIVVNCVADEVPWPLVGQLRVGARLVMPIGDAKEQELHVVTRHEDSEEEVVIPRSEFKALFKIMVGEAQE